MESSNVLYLIAAVVAGGLVPFAPSLLKLRIKILRKFHLNWFAEMHEKHFAGWVIALQTILFVSAIILLLLAIR